MLNLCPAAQRLLMRIPLVQIKRKISLLLAAAYIEAADQHVILKIHLALILGQLTSRPNVAIRFIHTEQQKSFLFFLAGGGFFWGRWGETGEVILEAGDIFNIPTGMFRGFENIGSDYGMIMAILGGDDAGGGVIWAPQVIEDAKDHGLVLGENGKLYDKKKTKRFAKNVAPMPLMTDEHLALMAEPAVYEVIPRWFARYLDLLALSADGPIEVIGQNGQILTGLDLQ